MKSLLIKIKNIFFKIFFYCGIKCKKYPWLVFILLVLIAFIIASAIFYQKAYLATNFSPDPRVSKIRIDELSLSRVKRIIQQREENIEGVMQKDFRDPFD